MSMKSVFSSPPTGVVVADPNRLLGIGAFIVAFFLPIAALPMAVIALRRSGLLGEENFWARLARNLSIFLLAAYIIVIAIGLTIAVIIPSFRN